MRRVLFWLAADMFCIWQGVKAWGDWEDKKNTAAYATHLTDISPTFTEEEIDEMTREDES